MSVRVSGHLFPCPQEFVALHGPVVLLFDDVHHFDTASWRLLAAVGAAAAGALLVAVAMRPQPSSPDTTAAGAAPESVAACVRQCRQALMSGPGAVSFALESFAPAETEQYMAQALADLALPSKQVTLTGGYVDGGTEHVTNSCPL